MRLSAVLFSLVLVLFGCGGGSSSGGNNGGAQGVAPPQFGGITLLVGDGPLDNVEEVWIEIREIRLLGDDGQVTITEGSLAPIDLLSLRNITELIASDEVPAGEYSKIRLLINTLEIVETEGSDRVGVQLPANGKIDLNPQGAFEISPGEDLVVQIDIDLDRSIQIVETGNSQYRFRPVVFIDVLDQAENLRLTKIFGTLQDDRYVIGDEGPGEESEYDLCEALDEEPCIDVVTNGETVLLDADGVEVVPAGDFIVPAEVHVFGHYFIGAAGGEFFRAKLIAVAAERGLTQIDGVVNSDVVDDAFELLDDTESTRVLIGNALLLDEIGADLEVDIAAGQEAEAWALNTQLDVAEVGDFPAILVQIDDAPEVEESIEGNLVDLDGNTLTVRNDEGDFCVTLDENTEIQLLSDYDNDAETDSISRVALGDLISVGVEVEAFGELVGDCLEADLIAAEIED